MTNVRIIYNGNIKMSPGKLAAQAVHAALKAYGIEHGSVVVLQGSVTKVNGMDVQIQDAGLTELKPGTLTCGATLEMVDDSTLIACMQCGKKQTHRVCDECFTGPVEHKSV